jgi:hypothetical protein
MTTYVTSTNPIYRSSTRFTGKRVSMIVHLGMDMFWNGCITTTGNVDTQGLN